MDGFEAFFKVGSALPCTSSLCVFLLDSLPPSSSTSRTSVLVLRPELCFRPSWPIACLMVSRLMVCRSNEEKEEAKKLVRVATQNMTGINLLLKLGPAAAKMTVGWDLSQHPRFAAMKLSR